MGLRTGTQLGPYEILSAIGAGGMGEVYRARDTRLDRVVAIKILPDHLADRAELRERFEREARTVASLNHSHICILHDIGRQDGTDYLVMEYLEGETLAQRLTKGALPLDQVLRYAIEIADALDKAHRKGITHRDLKPGNIMLTKSGTKLLDFGLAKLKQEVAPANVQLSQLPTAGDPLTAQGTIVGTLQYMAPEQLEGKEVDARTDIFAFGTVVYEMATGKKAFEGKSQASLIAKILETDPPPISSLQPMTPPALDRVVKKCLAKEPEKRWQSASDLTDALTWIAEGGSQGASLPAASAKDTALLGRRTLVLAAGCSLAVGIVAAIAGWNLKPVPARPAQPVSRVIVPLPPNEQLTGNTGTMLALAPDGTQLAYVAGGKIYLRALDTLEAKPLTGTEGAFSPFFSPDGQWIGFFANGKLKKVAVNGGAVLTLCDAVNPHGGAWGANDTIVFAPRANGTLFQVSAAGGAPQPLTKLKESESSHGWPQFLPDGKAILYTIGTGGFTDDALIASYRLDTGEQKILIRGGTYPKYVPTGYLVYYRAGTIMAVPFDAARLAVLGTPAPAIEGVMSATANNGAAQFSISSMGSLVYVPGGLQAGVEFTMAWVDRKRTEQPLPAPPHAYGNPRLSPDGRQVVLEIADAGKDDIWIYDLVRDTLTRLTFEGLNGYPVWTPDGKRVAYRSLAGLPNIYWKPADGSGTEERLTTVGGLNQTPYSFSPDGRTLVYNEFSGKTGYDLWVLPMQGERKPQLFLQTPFNERAPRLSPDGRWLAYVSDESGRYEVYVRPFPGPGGKWQVSTEGASEVTWSPKGNELFYRTGEQREKMMVVDIQTQPSFSTDKPRQLFEGPYANSAAAGSMAADYSIAADGQRFLMLKPREQQQQTTLTQIVVVQNWFEELKQRVPAGTK
jgi:Tol biopolymer transport system component/predicted Ser/Thr protein kinase